MNLHQFMTLQKDYYIGGLSVLPDDVPDGAWYQMRIDTIEYLSEPENLRMVCPQGTPRLQFDANDILIYLLEKELI